MEDGGGSIIEEEIGMELIRLRNEKSNQQGDELDWERLCVLSADGRRENAFVLRLLVRRGG